MLHNTLNIEFIWPQTYHRVQISTQFSSLLHIDILYFSYQQGLLSVGFFAGNETLENLTQNRYGLFHGGGFYLLGIQTLTAVCLIAWTSVTTLMILIVSLCQVLHSIKTMGDFQIPQSFIPFPSVTFKLFILCLFPASHNGIYLSLFVRYQYRVINSLL